MNKIRVVTRELLAQVSEQARISPRLRKNHNFHPGDASSCHRLLNALEPGTYIRPHRHQDPEKDEAFIIMSGRLGVVMFSENGEVLETVTLSHESGNLAADVPHGLFHTAVCLESGTVFYETKAGPYLPLTDAEIAAWAPAEDDPAMPEYLELLCRSFS